MDPYIGEVRIVGFNFAPRGWALCQGQLMPISQNTALFSLLGTMYGGDGKTTFGLPDFRDIAPMSWGSAPGLTERYEGETGGSSTVTLITNQLPSHSHVAKASGNPGATNVPTGGVWAATGGPRGGIPMYTTASAPAVMNVGALTPQGQSTPHNNMQPYLTLNFIIALQGVYPTRS